MIIRHLMKIIFPL